MNEQLLADLARRVTAALQRRAGMLDDAVVERLSAVLATDYAVAGEVSDGPLADLASVFELSDLDVLLLAAAAAPEFDATFGTAYGVLQGDASALRPSVGLALELAAAATLDPTARARLGAAAPLRANDLLEVMGDVPLLARSLRVPDRVVAHLAGEEQLDPVVSAMLLAPVALTLPEADELAGALKAGASLTWITARAGAAGIGVAAGAFEALGAAAVVVDVRRRPAGVGIDDAVRIALREAGLLLSGLVLVGADEVAASGGAALLRRLQQSPVPVVAIGADPWDPEWTLTVPHLMDAPMTGVGLRSELWQQQLGDEFTDRPDSAEWETLVALRLTPEQIARAARHAAGSHGSAPDLDAVRESARFVGSSGLRGAHRARPHQRLDDLIMPEQTKGPVREIIRWATHREAVLNQGPVGGKNGRGRGITVLFAGPPGTGKTLAANVIAGELGLDLQTVDLSSIVDKYIGETEKRLEALLEAAENMNAVLLFDEADALFGSRSDVKDARDRYANQEVSYLLQRIERFDGIAILTTNQRGNIDAAFSRRLNFVLTFPSPDKDTRESLWHGHLAALSALSTDDPVDVPHLAASYELAGGDIRNIVLSAAYAAADEAAPVGMRHITLAVGREMRKLGRMEQGLPNSRPSSRR